MLGAGGGGRLSCGWSFFSFLEFLGHSQWAFLATFAKSCLSFGSQGNLLRWGEGVGCLYSMPVGNGPNPLSLYPVNKVSMTQCASPYRDLHQGASRCKGHWQFIEGDLSSSLQRSSD